ncbi:hypothetical protein N7450_011727 [Penicillium hetheringtonii]|uniref:Zn(2)-C6 fungal-type domain-containing protein n=1 Tax=Penicillium hetheringtonii TaxID=911720 RepID=A0AAD6GL78_9EURO|nr:hypothetical protein N7450_011727 [Penicillium hetheringtonii]
MSGHVTPGSTSPLPASEPRPQSRPKQRIGHTKSRNGCLVCKSRRVKCDEVQPVCGACSVRGDDCVFASPKKTRDPQRRRRLARSDATSQVEASPGGLLGFPAISIHSLDFNVPHSTTSYPPGGSTNRLNMHDLTLLQHYILHTSKKMTLNNCKGLVWERVIPEIAASHAFLMHLLLALAGLDMLTTNKPEAQMSNSGHLNGSISSGSPAVKLQSVVEHHQQGLQGLQEKLAIAKDTDMDVLFAGSMLVVAFAFASHRVRDLYPMSHEPRQQVSPIEPTVAGLSSLSNRPQINWLRLVRGVSSIVQYSWTTLKLGRLRPLLLYSNANDDWKLHGPELTAKNAPPENMRSGSLSAFAVGAPLAILKLREFLSILRTMSSDPTQGNLLHPEPPLGPTLGASGTAQRDDLFAAQDQSITVVENMYMRIMYVIHLRQIELSSSCHNPQPEMEEAAISSWPHLVPATFISSLESNENLEITTGFSFAILAHLYLCLALLDDIWYFGEIFGSEIRRIEFLVAEINNPELSQLVAWPVRVVSS